MRVVLALVEWPRRTACKHRQSGNWFPSFLCRLTRFRPRKVFKRRIMLLGEKRTSVTQLGVKLWGNYCHENWHCKPQAEKSRILYKTESNDNFWILYDSVIYTKFKKCTLNHHEYNVLWYTAVTTNYLTEDLILVLQSNKKKTRLSKSINIALDIAILKVTFNVNWESLILYAVDRLEKLISTQRR